MITGNRRAKRAAAIRLYAAPSENPSRAVQYPNMLLHACSRYSLRDSTSPK